MEAILFDTKKKNLIYKTDHPIPKIENDNDVIVKVAFSGVCGTDIHIIEGEFPVMESRPYVLGHEFSGTVVDMGANVKLTRGQKVAVDPNGPCNLCENCREGNYHYCLATGSESTNIGTWMDGGWSTYCKAPAERIYVLPEEVSLEKGGLCEPYSCVAHGFDRASPIAVGKSILISGAGIIGNLWISTLYHHGHRNITVSELNTSRLDIVKKLDLKCRLVTPNVLEMENSQFDVIVDCTGVGKVMEINMNYLKSGGKYLLFGCCPPSHKVTINPFDIFNKEITILGAKVNPFTFPKAIGWLSAMDDKFLNYDRLGVKVFKLSDYKEAIKTLKNGSIAKAMFKVE